MPIVQSLVPVYVVLTSAVAIIPIALCSRRPNLREFWTFLAGFCKLALVLSMVPLILKGKFIGVTLFKILPGISIAFKVDGFGMLFALVATSLWLVTTMYSIGYMRGLKEHAQTRYFCFFALSLSATLGVAFSANLLTLYLFYELLSLATYPLVTHHQDKEARGAGRKYLIYLLGGSIGLALPAMLILYGLTGTLEFTPGGVMDAVSIGKFLPVLLLMFLYGFGKAGMMPFHSWLPGAMVAPTPVSALLHAVAVVKVGVFSIVRVLHGLFGAGFLTAQHLVPIVCYLAGFTVIVASLIALYQDNLKRRLAFSTIGQLSYIIMGVGLASQWGIVGGMTHIAMHAFGKITLFFCAGAIFVATGEKYISKMAGIGRRMPYTMLAFFIGSLSVIGIPPTGGFISKWYLLTGALQAHQIGILVIYLVSSLLNACYFLPIVYRAFFSPEKSTHFEGEVKEAPLYCVLPPLITAAASVALFFFPQVFMSFARLMV